LFESPENKEILGDAVCKDLKLACEVAFAKLDKFIVITVLLRQYLIPD
jgi:hypothetical protein